MDEEELFYTMIKDMGFSLDFTELDNFKSLDNYINFKNYVQKKNSIAEIKIPLVDRNRLYNSILFLLNIMYHDFIPYEDMKKMIGNIVIMGGDDPFDASVNSINDKIFIFISSVDYVQSILTIVHEITHCIVPFKYTNNYHVIETLPIFSEIFSSSLLDDLEHTKNLYASTLNSRLIGLKNCLNLERKEDKNIKDNFLNHMEYSYLLSTLYAYNLYYYYLQDSKVFFNKLNDSLKSDSSIYDLLKYYDMSLKNNNILLEPVKMLNKVR